MSRIKCWLDMHDRLPELSDLVLDDPEVDKDNRTATEKFSKCEASIWKTFESIRSASEKEPF